MLVHETLKLLAIKDVTVTLMGLLEDPSRIVDAVAIQARRERDHEKRGVDRARHPSEASGDLLHYVVDAGALLTLAAHGDSGCNAERRVLKKGLSSDEVQTTVWAICGHVPCVFWPETSEDRGRRHLKYLELGR
jgi:hypothetical protein